jgi:hypothetical protein
VSGSKFRVQCWNCNWSGVRTDGQCECYDEWRMYCRAGSPGPGCPRGVVWPCPKCGPNVVGSVTGFTEHSSVRAVGPVTRKQVTQS